MARDLSAQFQQLRSGRKRASDQLKAAAEGTKDRLAADVAGAGERAAAAQRLTDKAAESEDEASSQWQEIREKW